MNIPYCPRCNFDAPSPSDASLYQSLNHDDFRLLRLDAFTAQGLLQCRFEYTPLSDAGMYSAISYTWNETEPIWYGEHDATPKPISINGTLVRVSDKVANILCLAFQAYRRRVWIDSISIDQANMTEKGEQVAQMGQIYRLASDVLCFIGGPSLESDSFFDRVNAAVDCETIDYTIAAQRGFERFTDNAYWTRAWTLQEMVLAREPIIYCGSKTVLLSHVAEFRRKLTESLERGGSIRDFVGAVQQKLLLRWNYVFGSGLAFSRIWESRQVDTDAGAWDILRQCRASNACTDPRDLVYSRRALSANIATLVPDTDYTIGVEQVYATFATNYIMVTRRLEIITLAMNSALHLPSWVPDWTSINSDWSCADGTELEHLKEVLMTISWHSSNLPQVTPGMDLLVQAKFVAYVDEVVQGLWSFSAGWSLIRRTRHRDAYVQSEVPRKDDAIFLLNGCPNPVCLRLSGNYHTLVGRNNSFQVTLIQSLQARPGFLWRARAAQEIVVRIK